MKPPIVTFVLSLALAGSAGLRPLAPAAQRPSLACEAVEGAAALLARPKGDIIVIDGINAAFRAAGAIGCLAAAAGERVIWTGAAPDRFALLAARYVVAGARAEAAALPALSNLNAEGDAQAGAMAAWVAQVRARRADRLIVVVVPPYGARQPVGLAGETWRPLGARLAGTAAIALRAEASARPGVRVRLKPFSDVPERGAALRYDGLIEVGPEMVSPSNSSLR